MEASLMDRLWRARPGLIARAVPARDRKAWLLEWNAELRERWHRLSTRNQPTGSRR